MFMNKFTIFIILIFICGCATTVSSFYGIGMNSVYNAKDFEITSYSNKGVRYNYDHRTMNSDVSAWAEVNWAGLQITIENNANSPVHTNYFTDDFILIAKDGKEFRLGKDIQTYYSGEYINPDHSVSYYLSTPYDGFSTDVEKFKEEAAMIICEIGTYLERVTIVLKPLPEEQKNP